MVDSLPSRSSIKRIVLWACLWAIPGACFFSALACAKDAAPAAPPLEVKIDPSANYGIWEGWGTSLCWMGNVFGGRDDVADFLFTTKTVVFNKTEVPGLGLNIVRYNAGACSWNTVDGRAMAVSQIIKKYRQMEGFWLDGKNPDPKSPSWDWSIDARQRAMLRKAKERGADHFELFSNSPMWWMCDNGNPSGAADKTHDNLPAKNYPAFATYLATVARYAKDHWGTAFTSVEPFNEGTSHYWFADCKQEGCHFSAQAQIAFLPILRAELDRQGLKDLPIAAADESEYDAALRVWNAYPPAAKALATRVNVHGYQGAKGDRAGLHRLVVQEDGKKLWNSEHGDKDGSGLDLARNFHRDMHKLHPTAWAYWQPTDGGGWGMLECDMEKAAIQSVNPKAYVFAQYARHIRPGMAILGSGDANTVAAYDSRTGLLVLATLNDGPARRVAYDLSAFRIPDGPVSRVLTEPKGGVHYRRQPDLALENGRFTAECPADSVQTFEVANTVCP
jgi:galactan endo-1,6-beta-galactosidase